MYAVDLDNTAYWSDCQTNEQYFGLLAFDPGEERSVCYVGRIVQIHRVHGVPGPLEPLVLPCKHAAARAPGVHDVPVAVHQGLTVLLLRHVALVAACVDVPLGHASSGGDAVLGDDHLDRRMGKETRASMEYRISKLQGAPIEEYLRPEDYYDSQGRYNTYIAYLRALARHHTPWRCGTPCWPGSPCPCGGPAPCRCTAPPPP